MNREEHWQKVYLAGAPDTFSWFRPRLDASLELLDLAGLGPASRLIDALLKRG